MRIDLTTMSPLTTTLTIPPPADACTVSSLSDSWAATMSCCIFCTCLSIWAMFGWWGISRPPAAPAGVSGSLLVSSSASNSAITLATSSSPLIPASASPCAGSSSLASS